MKKKKIFRPKRRYRIKHPGSNAAAIKAVASVACLAVLVFVGYSAAGPVSRYLEQKAAENSGQSPEMTDDSASSSEPVMTDVSEPVVTDGTAVSSVSEPVSETSVGVPAHDIDPAVTGESTAPVQTTADYDDYDDDDSQNELQYTIPKDQKFTLSDSGIAYPVPESIMDDLDSLDEEFRSIAAQGGTAVILPMKSYGGTFNYKTNIDFVYTDTDDDDVVVSDITAEMLAYTAKSAGLRPVARISVLADNNRYGEYRDGAYRNSDDTAWLDANPDDGGKPWLSPFDQTAQDYICDIVRELANAGFEEIIAEDFVFPSFRSSDIDRIGDFVEKGGDRYLALTDLAKMMTRAGKECGASVMIRVTAHNLVKGYGEIFHPEELQGCSVIVDYSERDLCDDLTVGGEYYDLNDMDISGRADAVFSAVDERCDGISTAVYIHRNSMDDEEYADLLDVLKNKGYTVYYIY